KTRLALQVATTMREHFANGVCFVPLAAISDPEMVAAAIAQELGIQGIGSLPLVEQIEAAEVHWSHLEPTFQGMTRCTRARSCLSHLPSRATPAPVLPRQEEVVAR